MAEAERAAGTPDEAGSRKTLKANVESSMSELFLRFTTREGSVKGFAGVWTFFRPDSADDAAITSTFRCIRTYEVLESEPAFITFRTFNEAEPAKGKAQRRDQDGLFESSYRRHASDPYFTNSAALSDVEQREGVPGCLFWRSIAVDSENVVRLAPNLPPKPLPEGSRSAQYPGWSPESMSASTFAFEAFLEEDQNRWAMGALYSTQSLQLLAHFCIQEHLVTFDPDKEIHFDELPFREPRQRLRSDVSEWLEGGSFKGEMREVVWDEEGDSLKLPTRPATWTPPDQASSTHRLFLYPDSMYAYYPLQLPAIDEASTNTFAQGARFEVGGLCRRQTFAKGAAGEEAERSQEFRRLVLRYSHSGQATSLTKELYKSRGSFEFEKRRSMSIRRSMDTRVHSTLATQPLLAARREKLQEQAARHGMPDSPLPSEHEAPRVGS